MVIFQTRMGFGPETLRALADAIEDPRQMDNVETCRHIPGCDQHLLLALNRTRKREKEYVLPDARKVREWLNKVLISVETSDGQSAALGIFFTNRCAINRKMWQVAVGVFPLYADITRYYVRPEISSSVWDKHGSVMITDRSVPESDSFMISVPGGLEVIFFKKNPFTSAQPYQTQLPENWHYQSPELHEEALEANIIARALWFAARGTKPHIFREPGFADFIKEHKREKDYEQLYRVWRFKFRDTGSPFAY